MTDKEYQEKIGNFRTKLRCTCPELSLRKKADEIGISAMTVFRILTGREPSLKNYIQINEWFEFIETENKPEKQAKGTNENSIAKRANKGKGSTKRIRHPHGSSEKEDGHTRPSSSRKPARGNGTSTESRARRANAQAAGGISEA